MTTRPGGAITAVDLPDSPPIAGLRFRTIDLDVDSEAIARVFSDSAAADGQEFALTAEDVRHDLEHTANLDLARDVVAAEIGGRLVGVVETHVVVRDGVAVHQFEGCVHPDHRRRGIGRALLTWTERRAGEAATEWAGDEPHELGTWVDDQCADGIALLEAAGYRRIRYGFSMVRPLSEPIPDAPLPAGLEIRPVIERDHRAIWEADIEAFRDHWQAAQRTEEDFVRWFTMPNLDTGLWRVAWEGDQVAGSVWNVVWSEENERLGLSRGWLEHISVRRPWRKRGVASALIADSLRMFQDMGLREGMLGVDAENPTGALRLYESLGFHRHRTGISFRKSL